MNIEKFLYLITQRSLYICKITRFIDKWEGVWPKKASDELKRIREETGNDLLADHQKYLDDIYVSCWHESEVESAALWGLYSGDSGIAIRSTAGDLRKSIIDKRHRYISRVKYIDHKTDSSTLDSLITPAILKRKSFEHEREIRLIYWANERLNRLSGVKDLHNPNVEINPNTLINELYISPTSNPALRDTLESVCRKFDLTCKVIKSDLYDPAIY